MGMKSRARRRGRNQTSLEREAQSRAGRWRAGSDIRQEERYPSTDRIESHAGEGSRNWRCEEFADLRKDTFLEKLSEEGCYRDGTEVERVNSAAFPFVEWGNRGSFDLSKEDADSDGV